MSEEYDFAGGVRGKCRRGGEPGEYKGKNTLPHFSRCTRPRGHYGACKDEDGNLLGLNRYKCSNCGLSSFSPGECVNCGAKTEQARGGEPERTNEELAVELEDMSDINGDSQMVLYEAANRIRALALASPVAGEPVAVMLLSSYERLAADHIAEVEVYGPGHEWFKRWEDGDERYVAFYDHPPVTGPSGAEGEGAREALERTRWILERALHAYDKTETTMDGLVELVVSVKEAHDIARAALASQATAQEKNDG